MNTNFFGQISRHSVFWLPSFLEEMAKLPPIMCAGDGCSIFLSHKDPIDQIERIYLAGTTRSEMRTQLFADHYRYEIDPAGFYAAERSWRQNGKSIHGNASLTGWVAAFDVPLVVSDLHNDDELDAIGKRESLPRPVWSMLNRGPRDSDKSMPRSFLCVPIHGSQGQVLGAMRVSTTKSKSAPFKEPQAKAAQEFADALGTLLDESGVLATVGLEHYFRLWGAEDIDDLGRRVTTIVPKRFGVDSCSLFLRDPLHRFVLRHSASRDQDDERFEEFARTNCGRLFYLSKDGSKTSLCIDSEIPVLLIKDASGKWTIARPDTTAGQPLDDVVGAPKAPAYVKGEVPEFSCEFPDEEVSSILLVPIPDPLSITRPAGVLRIVSKSTINDPNTLETLLVAFSQGLGDVLSSSWRRDLQRRARHELVSVLSSKLPFEEKIEKAAAITCASIDAGSVTIYLREGETLRTKSKYTHLAPKYLAAQEHAELVKQHTDFTHRCEQSPYTVGYGRTGWVARYKRVLNLQNMESPEELERKGVQAPGASACEFKGAGPFLGAPIMVAPAGRVDGVIRAIRRKASGHGRFNAVHEEILETCAHTIATMLAASRWQAVVSFSTKGATNGRERTPAFDKVEEWVQECGGHVLALIDRTEHTDPLLEFRELCQRADVGIVVATVDTGGSLSSSIHQEAIAMKFEPQLRDRMIVLQMEGAEFTIDDVIGKDVKVIRFGNGPGGISNCEYEFKHQLNSWFGDKSIPD